MRARISARLRAKAVELLRCAADMPTALGQVADSDDAPDLRLARLAWLSVDGWMINEPGDVRSWERAVLLEAAALLEDGWCPGDPIEARR